MIVLSLLAVLVAAEPAEPRPLSRVDFATGQVEQWSVDTPARASTPARLGDMGGAPLELPQAPPSPATRTSSFSMLFRARDAFDLSRHPARAVAKLHRLTPAGERQGTACTAQFVGPRHLLTAAHCVIDRSAGRPHPGFELALRHDGGRDEGVVPVIAAWAPTTETLARRSVVQATGEFDLGADCWDIALIEINEPRGNVLGWLGMTSEVREGGMLHRFSYPHRSTAELLEADLAKPDQPEQVAEFLREELTRYRLSEPDFSPDNLYFEYGAVDRVQAEALTERNGAVLPGRSGSAMIDAEGRVAAVMSRAALGENASCRLTPELIGAFAEIAGLEG